MEVNIDLRGFGELRKKMSGGIPKATVHRAVFEVGTFMRNEVANNLGKVIYSRAVPWTRTGKLRQSVILGSGTDVRRVFVGVDYGAHVEYGTRARTIKAKGGKTLSFTIGGQRIFAKQINHPGTKAYPFWRPAVAATKVKTPFIVKRVIETALTS